MNAYDPDGENKRVADRVQFYRNLIDTERAFWKHKCRLDGTLWFVSGFFTGAIALSLILKGIGKI